MLIPLIKTLRPKQWTKNGFIFFPLAFNLNEYWTLFSAEMYRYVGRATSAFVIFCVLSGAVYMINDVVDIEKDRLHPIKRNRPIAAGRISPTRPLPWRPSWRSRLAASFALTRPLGMSPPPTLCSSLPTRSGSRIMVILDVMVLAAGIRAARGRRRAPG